MPRLAAKQCLVTSADSDAVREIHRRGWLPADLHGARQLAWRGLRPNPLLATGGMLILLGRSFPGLQTREASSSPEAVPGDPSSRILGTTRLLCIPAFALTITRFLLFSLPR